jgi:FtsZ-binding cell division protein ZapB
MVQVGISSSPSADWRRLFYEAERNPQADFTPRSVEITGTLLRFKSDPASVEQRIATLDRWMEKATLKEASMAGRSEAQRQKQEEAEREAQELAEWNARWAEKFGV